MSTLENTPTTTNPTEVTPVTDFTTFGFEGEITSLSAEALEQLEGVEALAIKGCVTASYNPTTNQICFKIPVFGSFCFPSPVKIPVGGALKACFETCGRIIPTGVKVTVYLDNKPIFTKVIGKC
jgi:hypothetical protein